MPLLVDQSIDKRCASVESKNMTFNSKLEQRVRQRQL